MHAHCPSYSFRASVSKACLFADGLVPTAVEGAAGQAAEGSQAGPGSCRQGNCSATGEPCTYHTLVMLLVGFLILSLLLVSHQQSALQYCIVMNTPAFGSQFSMTVYCRRVLTCCTCVSCRRCSSRWLSLKPSWYKLELTARRKSRGTTLARKN